MGKTTADPDELAFLSPQQSASTIKRGVESVPAMQPKQSAVRQRWAAKGYPPGLDTLVNGVDVQGKKLKFLRRIPVDSMTGKNECGLRSMQDDPTSESWGGQKVFDVYTKSQGEGLDGTKYKDW